MVICAPRRRGTPTRQHTRVRLLRGARNTDATSRVNLLKLCIIDQHTLSLVHARAFLLFLVPVSPRAHATSQMMGFKHQHYEIFMSVAAAGAELTPTGLCLQIWGYHCIHPYPPPPPLQWVAAFRSHCRSFLFLKATALRFDTFFPLSRVFFLTFIRSVQDSSKLWIQTICSITFFWIFEPGSVSVSHVSF